METKEIMEWLETNCKDVSIVWKVYFKGQIEPIQNKHIIAYNIHDATERGVIRREHGTK